MVALEHASVSGKYQVYFFISFLAKELVLAKLSKSNCWVSLFCAHLSRDDEIFKQ
jgi:hypothetical protein